ncbi:MAG: hypothetical protein WCC11_11795 [Gammaproteobacteria bacterium]
MADALLSFMARLKRHHIFRVASVYAIVAWVLIQVANGVFPDIGLTRADVRVVIAAVALLFPVALVLGWMFIPPSKENPAKFSSWQHLRWKLGSVLTLVIVVLVVISGIYLWHVQSRQLKAEEVAATKPPAATSAPVAATVIPAKSIAVLPFVNLSGDPQNKYFSDGITEEILNALAQIPDLKVAGRTSAFRFNSKDEDLRKVGQTLGVATVLEGSVQRSGGEVRITAQLIDTRSGYQRWSEKYDRKLTNIFAIEDEISNAIAGKLRVQLTGAAGQALVVQQAIDPRAHDFYLRGLALLAARGPGLRDAVADFQNAVKIDPGYAQAWGALAETELALPGYVVSVPRDDAVARAESAAQTALHIDSNTVSALVAMAGVYADHLQWQQAQDTYRRAIALAPGDAEAADQYAQFLFATDQLDPALEQINRARQMDPLSAIIGVVRSGILMALHRDVDATAQLELVLSAHPDFYPANLTAVTLYVGLGRFADAERQMRTMATNFGVDADAKVILVRGIADPGRRSAALASLKGAPANADIRTDQVWYSAFLAMLGDRADAIAQLQAYASRRNAAAFGMVWTSAFDALRNDPRFKAVLKKMGLPYTPQNTSTP